MGTGLSLLLITSGSRVARHTRRRAKVLGEDTVLCYLFCLVSGIPHLMLGMDFWSKGLLKRRICLQRVFRSKSPRHKTFASLALQTLCQCKIQLINKFLPKPDHNRPYILSIHLKCRKTLLYCVRVSYNTTQLNINEKHTEKSQVLGTACHANHLISRCIYLHSFSLQHLSPIPSYLRTTLEPRAQHVIDT